MADISKVLQNYSKFTDRDDLTFTIRNGLLAVSAPKGQIHYAAGTYVAHNSDDPKRAIFHSSPISKSDFYARFALHYVENTTAGPLDGIAEIPLMRLGEWRLNTEFGPLNKRPPLLHPQL